MTQENEMDSEPNEGMYQFMYQCRFCDQVYSNGGTTSEVTAWRALALAFEGSAWDYSLGNPVRLRVMHMCEGDDEYMGVADLIGVARK